jgi:spore maturation protein SpmA
MDDPVCFVFEATMLNWIFIILIAGSVLTAAFTGTMPKVTAAGIASARTSVDLAIGLIGQMALWLGFMGVLREAGLMRSIARGLQPVMVRLFPQVPAEHPAMSAMIMNLAANMLGLGNAATPFGLKAMTELQKLNPFPTVATNPMALFLAINTSGVAVLPLGVIAVRATLKSTDPAGITIPTLLATMCSTITAIIVAKSLERSSRYAPERFADEPGVGPSIATAEKAAPTRVDERPTVGVDVATTPDAPPKTAPKAQVDEKALAEAEKAAAPRPPATGARRVVLMLITAAVLYALVRHFIQSPPDLAWFDVTRGVLSDWLLPILMLAIVAFGFGRRVKVYEAFVAAAKEGFQISVMIIPFLVAIIVAIGMFRASGAMEAVVGAIGPFTSRIGFPAEALPMAFIRPLSGSGALAVMTETMNAYGPDSFVGYLVSVINGSTETTFYVLAVYFGSVGVRSLRHTLLACIAADVVGISMAAVWCHIFFPNAP